MIAISRASCSTLWPVVWLASLSWRLLDAAFGPVVLINQYGCCDKLARLRRGVGGKPVAYSRKRLQARVPGRQTGDTRDRGHWPTDCSTRLDRSRVLRLCCCQLWPCLSMSRVRPAIM
jgi:hypothetical protein